MIVLAAALVVWAGAFYWRATRPAPAPAAAGETKSEGGRRAAAPPRKPGQAGAPPVLRLDLQERPLPALSGEGKNLFASVLPPPPPAPAPAAAAAAAPPPDPFLEEARKLRVVGIMQEDGRPVAFIDDGNEVHSVKKNDVIRSRFLVKDVTDDGVVVSKPNGEKEVRLALTPSPGAGQK